jgi:hypothetical protein
MMTTQAIPEHVKAETFRPFRIEIASGRTFEVKHPEMIKVLKSHAFVFKFDEGDAELFTGVRKRRTVARRVDHGTRLMMIYRKLGEYVAAEPFRPFRIEMASGQSFDIRHPEMILVGRMSVRIYRIADPDQIEKWHDVSMMLMETVEPLDVPVSQRNS